MPFVGKDLKTLELQKQRHLNELNQKSKNRDYYDKNKKHHKNFGYSLIKGRRNRTTLEQFLDASKIDKNIEDFLVKELGANPGQAKVFIQGLDDTLKGFLVERLPAYKKVFNDNFTVATAINLKSAFELFNREQLEKMQDLNIPSRSDLNDYLDDLLLLRVQELGLSIYQAQQEKTRRVSPVDAMRDFDNEVQRIIDNAPNDEDAGERVRRYVSAIIITYIGTFENPLDGWMASYRIAKSIGLRDFPKPLLKTVRFGAPTSTINTPLSSMNLGSMSEDYTIESPRSEMTMTSDDTDDTEEEKEGEPIPPPGNNPIPPSVREIRRRRIRGEGIDGSGYNTPGMVKIYKLKK